MGGSGGSKGAAAGNLSGVSPNPDSNINASAQTNLVSKSAQKVGEALNYPGQALARTAKTLGGGIGLAGGAIGSVDSSIKQGYKDLGNSVANKVVDVSKTLGGGIKALDSTTLANTNDKLGAITSRVSDLQSKLDPNRDSRVSAFNDKYSAPLSGAVESTISAGKGLYSNAKSGITYLDSKTLANTNDKLGALFGKSSIEGSKALITPSTVNPVVSNPKNLSQPLDEATKGIALPQLGEAVNAGATIGAASPSLRSNSYTNGENSISFKNRTISPDQKSYLDKTIAYNQRPEVIEGFARNAALTQGRIDSAKSNDEVSSIKSRLEFEQNKAFPNPRMIESLYGRLKDISASDIANRQLGAAQGSASAEDTKLRMGALQATTETERKNNDSFVKNIQSFPGNNISLTPGNVLATASTQGVRITPSLLSYAGIDEPTLNRIYDTKDAKSFADLLGSLNVPKQYITQLYESLQEQRG